MRIFALTLFALLQSAYGQEANRPPIIQEQRSNITHVHVEGSLAAPHALTCLSLSDSNASYAPPELHTGIVQCIQQGDFDKAARLFLLSGMYAKFDAARVADQTASAGGQVLIMKTFATVSKEQKEQFSASFRKVTSPPELPDLCMQITRIGPPSYFPKYLILHGLNAITSPNSLENAIKPDFDAPTTWNRLQDTYLHCPK